MKKVGKTGVIIAIVASLLGDMSAIWLIESGVSAGVLFHISSTLYVAWGLLLINLACLTAIFSILALTTNSKKYIVTSGVLVIIQGSFAVTSAFFISVLFLSFVSGFLLFISVKSSKENQQDLPKPEKDNIKKLEHNKS